MLALPVLSRFYGRASTCSQDGRVTWQTADGQDEVIEAQWTLIATGRTAGSNSINAFSRIRSDRLIALAFPWERNSQFDALILELANAGWWYAPPARPSDGYLVFVTDGEFLSYDPMQRNNLLHTMYKGSALLANLGEPPQFSNPNGIDATAGVVPTPVVHRLVAIGDAAIALDPLAGSGVLHSVEGAWMAAQELAEMGSVDAAYRSWFAALQAHQLRVQRMRYSEATQRFPEFIFCAS